MIKKSFFGLSEPRFRYEALNPLSHVKQIDIPKPNEITLHLKEVLGQNINGEIKIGDKIKTKQKICLSNKSDEYVISSITGTISSIVPITTCYGSSYTAISIKTDNSNKEKIDQTFEKKSESLTLKTMANFLKNCPGTPPINHLLNKEKSLKKIVIYTGDNDLLINNNLGLILNEFSYLNDGIKFIKNILGINNIDFVVTRNTIKNYPSNFEGTIITVPNIYPQANPSMIAYKLTGKIYDSKKINSNLEEICFLKAEAVSSIGMAFKNKKIPTKKKIIVIDKTSSKHIINVRIGTHVNHILKTLGISVNNKDKIIFGGPMTGDSIYSVDQPVLPDTEALLIQDKNNISNYSNYPCINCGACTRICPAKVPVNLLVRFLEVGQYQEGAELYDLFSCIECGLCSYVCTSKIPIFQYIKLAKYELDRTDYVEEMNE